MKTCELCGCEFTGRTHPGGRKERFCSDNCRVKAGYRQKYGLRTNRQRLVGIHGEPAALNIGHDASIWFAALVDAEGCLGFYRRESRKTDGQQYYFPMVAVLFNTNPVLVRHAVALLGNATKTVRTKRGNGRTDGCKDLYEVRVKRMSMLGFLSAIRPHLVAKTRQADLLLEYLEMHDAMMVRTAPPPRFEEIWREMAELNRRGNRGTSGA